MKLASLAMLNETFSVIFKYCDYGHKKPKLQKEKKKEISRYFLILFIAYLINTHGVSIMHAKFHQNRSRSKTHRQNVAIAFKITYCNTKCNLWTLRKLEKLFEINWLSHLFECIVNINNPCLHKGSFFTTWCQWLILFQRSITFT